MFLWEGFQHFWKEFSVSRHPHVYELLTRMLPFGELRPKRNQADQTVFCIWREVEERGMS